MKKTVLGKGLDALLPSETSTRDYSTLPIDKIKPNQSQPRKNFNEQSIEELASSIKESGLIQPLLVRKKENYYEIIAGERRWRASQKAGLKHVPAIIRDVTDRQSLEIGLIENLQREDLNPIEEAEAYEKLIDDFNLTHEEISRRISKNRSTITNQLRLLKLSDKTKKALVSGDISSGHARALLGLEYPEQMDQALKVIVNKKLSVRQTEKLVRELASGKKSGNNLQGSENREEDYYISHISEELKKSLGTKVNIRNKGNRGKIEIEYYSPEEFERIIGILTSNR